MPSTLRSSVTSSPPTPSIEAPTAGTAGAAGTVAEPVLACSGLVKRFGDRTAVDGVGFTIAPGECYGLLGPNGAGKTTTISMVCGLLARDAGEVTVCGERLTHRSTGPKSHIGYVPQELALYPELSTANNLRFFGRLYGLSGKRLEERVAYAMETVGLAERANDRIQSFSGGMKRRANIAAGLLHEPELLVLDEPTVGVDPQSRNAILETVLALRADGLAVLYTTHYMEEAERLCHRVGIIDAGRIVAEGTRRELVGQIGSQDRIRIAATGDVSAVTARLEAVDGVAEVVQTAEGLDLLAHQARTLLGAVLGIVASAGVDVSAIEVVEPDLEAVFLALTGKELRD